MPEQPEDDFMDEEVPAIEVEAEEAPAVQAPISTRDPYDGVGGAYIIGEDGKRIRVS